MPPSIMTSLDHICCTTLIKPEIRIMRKYILIYTLSLVTLLSSCALDTQSLQAYSGQRLAKENVATVTRWNKDAGILRYICIRGIDGKIFGTEPRYIDRYELLPGKHTLKIGLHRLNRTIEGWDSERLIDFDAEAGHDYEITFKEKGEEIIISVKDITR